MADVNQLPFDQIHPLEVAPQLRELQTEGSVHRIRTRVGDPAWLVTGYEHVRTLLADDRLGRAHPHPEQAARSGESALFGGPLGNYETEQVDHARMRSLLQPRWELDGVAARLDEAARQAGVYKTCTEAELPLSETDGQATEHAI